jgi:hypothetical protein
MKNKTEINCPKCNQAIRIPTGKHIKFSCPNCSNELEIDGMVKEPTKKSNYSWIITPVLTGLMIFGYKYYTNNKGSKVEANSNTERSIVNHINKVKQSNITNTDEFDKNLNLLIKSVDISNETTSDFAARLASRFPGEYNVGQICQIYDHVIKNWKYVNDSRNHENFRSASRSINNNLSGDCDDFAILIASLIESVGGKTRISFAYNEESGHAFTEVYVAKNVKDLEDIADQINAVYNIDPFDISYTEDADGSCWLNLDWFGVPKHPGGKYFKYDHRTIYYPTDENPNYFYEQD